MTNYKYSQSWFINSEIKNRLFQFLDKKTQNKMLEIGCLQIPQFSGTGVGR